MSFMLFLLLKVLLTNEVISNINLVYFPKSMHDWLIRTEIHPGQFAYENIIKSVKKFTVFYNLPVLLGTVSIKSHSVCLVIETCYCEVAFTLSGKSNDTSL